MNSNNILSSVISDKMIRWLLACILILIPFQRKLSLDLMKWSNGYSKYLNFIDEAAIIIFLPIALIYLFNNKNIKEQSILPLFVTLILVILAGMASGIKNGNQLYITALGIFDYIKNFFLIVIYAAFFTDLAEFKRIFRYVLIIAVVLGLVAFIQEAWALFSLYIAKKDISDPGNYIFQKHVDINLLNNYWRFGLFRTSSLFRSTTIAGLYSLLIYSIYFNVYRRNNSFVTSFLIISIVTSISRIVYAGFVIATGLMILRGRRWVTIILVPVLVMLLFMTGYRDLNIQEMLNIEGTADEISLNVISSEKKFKGIDEGKSGFLHDDRPLQHYREFSRNKAIEIWKDHPLLGVGPGMFGGVVSYIFNSYIYTEYNFLPKKYFNRLKSIDNFWAQLLAEMGIMGLFAFACIFLTIFSLLFMLIKRTTDIELKGLTTGLMVFLVVILLYTLGMGLNMPAVLYTYCAFTGIAIGCINRQGC